MKKRICTSLTVLALTCLLVMPLFAQAGSQVAIITVSGSGKTQDEAKQNALRNAIEQAFGTFISSNTQILNDELVKDEIVSVSSGNIQEYNVISEVQTPDGYWSNTVKAKVSIDKLTSFCESKGVFVEFKGALFALNAKQQTLNEQNEIKAITNMCKVLKEISEKSFDYEIAAGEPVHSNQMRTSKGLVWKDSWKIPLTITAKTNANFKIMSDYLSSTLKGLSLTLVEVDNYKNLGKDYETIVFCPLGYQPPLRNKKGKIIQTSDYSPVIIYLRKEESSDALIDFIAFFRKSLLNFAVGNDIGIIQADDLLDSYQLKLKENSNFFPVYYSIGGGGFGEYKIYNGEAYNPNNSIDFYPWCKLTDLFFDYPDTKDSKFYPFLAEIDANSILTKYGTIDLVISFWLFNIGYTASVLTYDDYLTMDDLGKVSGYKIMHRIGGSGMDQEGNQFRATFIGNQRWMAQDLHVTHFSNGDLIPGIENPFNWNEAVIPAISTNRYSGRVYNWYVISDTRNVCPSGWHVPSELEWNELINYLGGEEIAGEKLKNEKYFNAKNETVINFTGRLDIDNKSNGFAYWIKSLSDAKSIVIEGSNVKISPSNPNSGYQIRCIKD